MPGRLQHYKLGPRWLINHRLTLMPVLRVHPKAIPQSRDTHRLKLATLRLRLAIRLHPNLATGHLLRNNLTLLIRYATNYLYVRVKQPQCIELNACQAIMLC